MLDHLYPRLDELPDSHLGRYTEGGCANPLGGWFKDPMMTGYLLVHGNHRNYIEFKKIWPPWNPLKLDPGPNQTQEQCREQKKWELGMGKRRKSHKNGVNCLKIASFLLINAIQFLSFLKGGAGGG